MRRFAPGVASRVGEDVHGVVDLRGARLERRVDLVGEVVGGDVLALSDEQARAQPVDVLRLLQLGDAGGEHQLEEVDELVGMRADHIVRLAAQRDEARVLVGALVAEHVPGHGWGWGAPEREGSRRRRSRERRARTQSRA